MNRRQLWNAGKQLIARGLHQIETKVKEWTKPAPAHQNLGVEVLVRIPPICGQWACKPN